MREVLPMAREELSSILHILFTYWALMPMYWDMTGWRLLTSAILFLQCIKEFLHRFTVMEFRFPVITLMWRLVVAMLYTRLTYRILHRLFLVQPLMMA